MPIGMLSPSANVMILSALPSPSVSCRILTESRPGLSSGAAHGYSNESVIHIRPRSSKAMFIGLKMSGSDATNCTSKPSGTCNAFNSSCGESASVGRTPAANGS